MHSPSRYRPRIFAVHGTAAGTVEKFLGTLGRGTDTAELGDGARAAHGTEVMNDTILCHGTQGIGVVGRIDINIHKAGDVGSADSASASLRLDVIAISNSPPA
ncbi:hypothetical protein C7960_1414 [Methanohalophilus euhalobius]|jgi:hypothetical protein|uniref:Uncharacterized protein n=2 Tax=Methanohalophilus euhalobius TaxID=51203 RepID=A0A285F9C2_9EURY|nr:hypothetical protein C7960_1414 [Methanohalophilus euhalobius]SNY07915.1 hypothetical protein SAMN06295989_103222 [Methanohalophilus euhalobius]